MRITLAVVALIFCGCRLATPDSKARAWARRMGYEPVAVVCASGGKCAVRVPDFPQPISLRCDGIDMDPAATACALCPP